MSSELASDDGRGHGAHGVFTWAIRLRAGYTRSTLKEKLLDPITLYLPPVTGYSSLFDSSQLVLSLFSLMSSPTLLTLPRELRDMVTQHAMESPQAVLEFDQLVDISADFVVIISTSIGSCQYVVNLSLAAQRDLKPVGLSGYEF